jgi:chemotaxis protein MotB
MKINNYLLILSTLLLLYACVPHRKYTDLESKYKKLEEELKTAKENERSCCSNQKELETQILQTKKANEALSRDTSILGASYRQMREQYDKINKLNEDIMRKLEILQRGSEAEAGKLSTQLELTKLELQRKEESLKKLESELNAKAEMLKAKEKRIQELEELLAKQEQAQKALFDKVNNALLGFQGKGLTVEQKNGRVYVNMEAKLLFQSGSYAVDKSGQEILIKLAKVLEEQKDLEVLVEGHTDTDRLNSANVPRDNWELSVLRATSVVKILLDNSRMDKKRITAAGRSEYLPVDVSDKAKNRRIEIVLIPDLNELFKLIENKK